jgi:hypothetical protein
MSRSIVIDQPDWLLWVRRDAPGADVERAVEDATVVVVEESRVEPQKQAESSVPSDLPDSASSKGAKILKRDVKIDVCNAFYTVLSPF